MSHSGVTSAPVLIPVWGNTAELEAGGVMVEVAKKGQSLLCGVIFMYLIAYGFLIVHGFPGG